MSSPDPCAGHADPVQAQVWLCLDVESSAERAAGVSRGFFRLGWEMLGGELGERLRHAVDAGGYVGVDYGRAAAGELSALCRIFTYQGDDRQSEEVFVYSPERFEHMLNVLEQGAGLVTFDLATWVQLPGRDRLLEGEPRLKLASRREVPRNGRPSRWQLLYATLPFDLLLGTVERQEAVLTFLHTVAGEANPAGGEVSYKPPVDWSAPLEFLLRGSPDWFDTAAAAATCRRRVRSYSWVTVVSEEIGQRLGGPSSLRGSGAFHRVDHLAAGGFLLQATDRFEQYQQEQANRVFAVLAPALPSGTPGTGRLPGDTWNRGGDPGSMIVRSDPVGNVYRGPLMRRYEVAIRVHVFVSMVEWLVRQVEAQMSHDRGE